MFFHVEIKRETLQGPTEVTCIYTVRSRPALCVQCLEATCTDMWHCINTSDRT